MIKNKKMFKFLIGLSLIFFYSFNIFAFKRMFYDSDLIHQEKTIKSSKIKSKQNKVEKGFYFEVGFKTEDKTNLPANYADVLIRHFKKTSKEKFDGHSSYVDRLFKNYKVFKDGNDYIIRFYVFAKKEENLKKIKKFLKDNFSSKDYIDIFKSAESITKTEFDDYKEFYFSVLLKNLKKSKRKLKKYYKEKSYRKMEDLLSDFSQGMSSTSNFISTFIQNKKIKNKAKNMQQALKYIIKNNLKHSKKYDYDYDDDDYDDDYDDDDDEYYENYKRKKYSDYFEEKEFLNLKNKKSEAFTYLKEIFNDFFNDCFNNINKLKKVEFECFKNSLNSLKFSYNVNSIEKKIETYNGYVETISKI